MRRIALIIILALVLVACGPKDEPLPTVTIQEQPTNTMAPETIVAETIAEEPIDNPTPTEPPPTFPPTASPEASKTSLPVITPTEAVVTEVAESSPNETSEFNGQYENTFFRGSSNAPITLIDYSDFL